MPDKEWSCNIPEVINNLDDVLIPEESDIAVLHKTGEELIVLVHIVSCNPTNSHQLNLYRDFNTFT